MFISGVGETEAEAEEQGVREIVDHQEEYRTANELFELMTSNCRFDVKDGEVLTTQDVVLLYQNIDIGTKLINSANEARRPNQYVETIVYKDDLDSDSDISDDDLPNIFKINQERLNIFNNSSLENVLSQKLGDLKIQISGLSSQYNGQFFKDPFVKNQLRNIFDIGCNDLKTVPPTSLLDFICCKGLEDNYNIYMDNIISYVQRTIEQLKRISNGDYLTDRTKEKWREVTATCNQDISTLSNACIPLHTGSKKGSVRNWNDMVHSAIDVRSLSKILKKKIVVEIPKLFFGSFRVLGKRCADNLVISCKREKKRQKEDVDSSSQLDVVLHLKQTETCQITTRVNSIMIIETPSEIPTKESHTLEILPLPYKEKDCEAPTLTMPNFSAIEDTSIITRKPTTLTMPNFSAIEDTSKITREPIVITGEVDIDEASNVDTTCTESDCFGSYDVIVNELSCASSNDQKDIAEKLISDDNPEDSAKIISSDELRMTIQRLNMQTVFSEESTEDVTRPSKKKSPQRRIKSPYENKLYLMEEKKRKKLLEIRERREKRKQALSENCKVSKNKCGKIYTVQPSSSVTKLSITNKSFYNSIYGQKFNLDKSDRGKNCKGNKKDNSMALDVSIEEIEDIYDSPNVTPERYGKQYINRSYYLDEAETEVEQLKHYESNKDTFSASTSMINNSEFHNNIDLVHQFIGTVNNLEEVHCSSCQDVVHNNSDDEKSEVSESLQAPIKQSAKKVLNVKETLETHTPPSTLECRKSIERLYDLMRKSKKPNKIDTKTSSTKLCFPHNELNNNSIAQNIDNVTSLRNNFEESPSLPYLENTDDKKSKPNINTGPPVSVVPKVIISSKHTIKIDTEKIKKDRRKLNHPVVTKAMPENPLRAISQLLQEFDHVQKTKQRSSPDNKGFKKVEIVMTEGKNINRQLRDVNMRRRSRFDQHTRDNDQDKTRPLPQRERRKPVSPEDVQKNIHQPLEEKVIERNNIVKKKIMDIIEEAKEARGEAIRGPPKSHSRINTLSQPKKTYVRAHSEDYQSKYGRNLMADRLQRLAATTPSSKPEKGSPNTKLKARRNALSNDESINVVPTPSPLQITEKPFKPVPPNQISTIPPRSSPKNSLKTLARAGPVNRSNPMGPRPLSPVRCSLSPGRSSQCSRQSSPLPRRPPSRKPSPENCMDRIPESPEVRSKMVAVESYVKNHYGVRSQSPKSTQLLQTEHKSRVQLVPKDMTLLTSSSNAGEANEVGSAVMNDMNSLQHTQYKVCDDDPFIKSDTYTYSDFKTDISEDKNSEETAVDLMDLNKLDTIENFSKCALSSKTELEKLENALHNQMSGAFQKKLRIKNLTLTPKQSMPKVYMLQSGDANSLLVKSLSKIKIKKCDGNKELKRLPVMLNNNFKFDFMQISPQQKTVGFALTSPMAERQISFSNIASVSDRILSRPSSLNCTNIMLDKVIQCFKGVSEDQRQENAVQVVVDNEIPNMTSVSLNFNKTDAVIDQFIANAGTSLGGTEQIALLKKDKTRKEKIRNNKSVKDTVMKNHTRINNASLKNNVIKSGSEDCYKEKDSDIVSMVQTNVGDGVETLDKNAKCAVSEKTINPEYTSSLDVLVGLLNEIQKITNQTYLHNSNTDLNTILTNAATKENVVTDSSEPRIVSSVEKLKKLDFETKPSIYSLYISTKDCMKSSSYDINIGMNKSLYVDKEVDVEIEKNMVTAFTEPPSIFPITINHSTNVTNSLIGVLSEPSIQSIYSCNNHPSWCSHKIIDSQSVKTITVLSPAEVKEKPNLAPVNAVKGYTISTKSNIATVVPVNNDISKFKVNKFIENYKEFDPVLKIKRDILVTVYSILVLTVFAALSFPELMVTNM